MYIGMNTWKQNSEDVDDTDNAAGVDVALLR
jgi:hypothetical protein